MQQQLIGTFIVHDVITRQLQQPNDGFPKICVVVDDIYCSPICHGECPPFARGRQKRKTAPPASPFPPQIEPLCASMIVRHSDNPTPMPSSFVVKKGSKIRSTFSLAMPAPESEIESSPNPFDVSEVETTMLRNASGRAHTASMPLNMRLRTTCCS